MTPNHTTTWNAPPPSVLTIGSFDGVHLGHQKIIRKLLDQEQQNGLCPTVFTLFPHPRMVLQPQCQIQLIQTIAEREKSLKHYGVKNVVIQEFNTDFAHLSAQDFIQDLSHRLNVKKIIVGHDHRFGKGKQAGITQLRAFGKTYGFEVEEISAQEINDITVSSTKIREYLLSGNLPSAQKYLGHSFTLSGEVVHGKKLGRTLSYPTANISIPEAYKLIPKEGIYLVKSQLPTGEVYGMMNIGKNPTIEGKSESIEVYFLDFQGDLYGKRLTIEPIKYLREEKKFASLQELKAQIQQDEILSRKLIKSL